MPTVQDVIHAVERLAPSRFAYDWDRSGFQLGERDAKVAKAVISLDSSLGAVRFAEENDAQLLLAHHPLVWNPIKKLDARDRSSRLILRLARAHIAFLGAHTNLDAAEGGVNDALASALHLQEIVPFGSAAAVKNLKLIVFSPHDAAQGLLDALAEAGAGVIGLYRRCAFMSPGKGTFEPLPGADPTIGEVGEREEVDELRIEMILPEPKWPAVVEALRKAHPYEEPAYDLVPLIDHFEQPIGRIGKLKHDMPLREFAALVDDRLATRSWTWGDPERKVRRVAVVGGGACDEWRAAKAAGADAFVTGEVKQDVGLEAAEEGLAILAAGHYATEQPGCAALKTRLEKEIPEIDWILFVPPSGHHGRPF
jgi:dinuclear metal center YbgI/SA1388 family protein